MSDYESKGVKFGGVTSGSIGGGFTIGGMDAWGHTMEGDFDFSAGSTGHLRRTQMAIRHE